MIHSLVPTDAILISRLELAAQRLRDTARTLPLDLTDDERVLLSKELNAAGDFVNAIDRILSGRRDPAPAEAWDEPPSVL